MKLETELQLSSEAMLDTAVCIFLTELSEVGVKQQKCLH